MKEQSSLNYHWEFLSKGQKGRYVNFIGNSFIPVAENSFHGHLSPIALLTFNW